MENNQQGPSKPGTMTVQKTNEDFNKKQPDPKDPNKLKAEATPEIEVPDLNNGKEENPEDLGMNNDDSQDNEVKNPEISDEDTAAEVVEDDANPAEDKVKRSNDVKI